MNGNPFRFTEDEDGVCCNKVKLYRVYKNKKQDDEAESRAENPSCPKSFHTHNAPCSASATVEPF